MFRMRFHEPEFPEQSALYIVWAEGPSGRRTVMAVTKPGLAYAAWDTLIAEYPRDYLRLQDGARVMREYDPVTGESF